MISTEVRNLPLIDSRTCSIEVRQGNGLKIGGPQIVFPLKDLSTLGDTQSVFIGVSQAARVVFELLYETGCNDKESIIFQARRGNMMDEDSELSGIFSLTVQPPENQEVRYLSQKQGRISHCYAYLNKDLKGGELCFFLNPHNQDLIAGLAKHFKVTSIF